MATGGALALAAGYAHADSDAVGAAADSPGVISGNTMQLPVDVPVNACGNTVNVVGLLNPAYGNKCANRGENKGGHGHGGGHHKDRPGTSHGGHGSKNGSGGGGGASAGGVAKGSPGVISGNGIQLPFDLPANVSGNSVSLVGLLNPTFGNASSNGGSKPPASPQKPPKDHEPATPPEHDEPAAPAAPAPAPAAEAPAPVTQTGRTSSLAETGSDVGLFGMGGAAMGLMLGGALLYRRFRPTPDGA